MNRHTPIYIPTAANLTFKGNLESWEIVRGALEDDGWTDLRPAPPASLGYVPRHLRPGAVARG